MKGSFKTRALAAFMSASMIAGMCPMNVLAVSGSSVAADGRYEASADVQRTTEDDEDESEWSEYGITVSLEVKDGVFSNITVTPDSDYKSENDSYYNKAVNKSKGFQTLLKGKAATAETIGNWDTVSGATRTSEAVKSAALEAIAKADEAKADEAEEEVHYVTMNVPYTDFYAAYNLTDAAVWEVADGIDAVSTATTSKFTGTTGLANGTYNDGTYIMGVTIPVQVTDSVYAKLNAGLTVNDNYYYVDMNGTPDAYTVLTVNEDGSYSFSKMTESTVSTDYLSITYDEDDLLNGGYGDYQINLDGFTTAGGLKVGENEYQAYNIYGAILNTADGKSYGMTALENLWFGTRVTNVEIAWSIKEGQGLCRAHGSGGPFYQFADMNGATLTSVDVITDLGIITVGCNLKLPEYYDGDLSNLAFSIANDSKVLNVSGIPGELEDVTVTVSGGLASGEKVVDGKVALKDYPVDGTSYTVTISSSNYPDISRTVSTPISRAQIKELQKWMDKAVALEEYAGNADLQEHVAEAEEMIQNAEATSAEAAELIGELIEKVKKFYPAASADSTNLFVSDMVVALTDAKGNALKLSALENPTYTLTYTSGRKSVTLTSGNLDSLYVEFAEGETATEGTAYTLTIVSDNYQDIKASLTTAADCGHDWKKVTTEPTCTEDGQTVYTCDNCHSSYIAELEALGHDYEESKRVKATETEEGYITYTCSRCGDTYKVTLAALGSIVSEAEVATGASDNVAAADVVAASVDTKAVAAEVSELVRAVIEGTYDGTAISEETQAKLMEAYYNGDAITNQMLIETVSSQDLTTEESTALSGAAEKAGLTIGSYLNIDVQLLVNDTVIGEVTQLNNPVTITVTIPASLKKDGRTFTVIRNHNGDITKLTTTDNGNGTVSFGTGSFSPYVLAYADADTDETTTDETTTDETTTDETTTDDTGINNANTNSTNTNSTNTNSTNTNSTNTNSTNTNSTDTNGTDTNSTTNSTSTTSAAATGDPMNPWAWMTVAVLAVGVAGVGIKMRRKQEVVK